jgi:hypothetical protein
MPSCRSCGSLDRRSLLKGAAALGAGSLASRLGQSRLFAQAALSGRRFVFVYFPGGWDQLLFLDPREFELGASEEAYRREVQRTQIDTSYRYGIGSLEGKYVQGMWFKPAVYRPQGTRGPFVFGPGTVSTTEEGEPLSGPNLVGLVERGVPMAIVRGINMGTLGHEPGYMYFLTGEPAVGSSARGTSMPIRIAAGLGEGPAGLASTIVPVVTMGVESYTGDKSGRYGAFVLKNLGDCARMLRRDSALVEHAEIEAALAAFSASKLRAGGPGKPGSALLRQIADSQERTAGLLKSDLAQRFAFLTDSDEGSRAVRERYGVGSGSDLLAPSVIAAFAAQAVKHGFAQFISIGFTRNIVDSHGSSNPGHLGGLHPCIRALAALVDDLASSPAVAPLTGSWLENTTIVAFSEFGRTPLHNYTNGRDHHFTNSCLLIGAGIRPASVVGASSEVSGMQPVPFDFAEQRILRDNARPANDKQRYILPEDIGATLLASAGLPYHEYRIGRPLWGAITHKPF